MNRVAERLATVMLFAANGIGMGAWAAEIPRIQRQLALSEGSLGIALLAFAVGAMLAMPVAGALGARYGNARPAALVSLLLVLCYSIPAFAPGYVLLIGSLILLGALNGSMDVLMNAHASRVEHAWSMPIMSSFHAAWSVGGLGGAALGGAIAGNGWSVHAGLVMPGIVMAAFVLGAVKLGLRREPQEMKATQEKQARKECHEQMSPGNTLNSMSRSGLKAALSRLRLPDAALLRLGGIAFLCMMAEGAVADWSAVYLNSVSGESAGRAAAGYAAFSFAMVCCRLVGDLFVRWIGRVAAVQLGGALAATGFGIVILMPNLITACVGFALVGIGLANVVPVIFSAASSAGANPAVGVSTAATIGYAGLLFGPPVIGFMAELMGLRMALLTLLLATLAVSLAGKRTISAHAAPAIPTT